jgi:hypothetical protein
VAAKSEEKEEKEKREIHLTCVLQHEQPQTLLNSRDLLAREIITGTSFNLHTTTAKTKSANGYSRTGSFYSTKKGKT